MAVVADVNLAVAACRGPFVRPAATALRVSRIVLKLLLRGLTLYGAVPRPVARPIVQGRPLEASAPSRALLLVLLRQHAQSNHGAFSAEGNGTPQWGRGAGRICVTQFVRPVPVCLHPSLDQQVVQFLGYP